MRLDADSLVWVAGLDTPQYREALNAWMRPHGLDLDRTVSIAAEPGTGIVGVTAYKEGSGGPGYRVVNAERDGLVTEEHLLRSEGFPEPDWEEAAKRLALRAEELAERLRSLYDALGSLRTDARNRADHLDALGKSAYRTLYGG